MKRATHHTRLKSTFLSLRKSKLNSVIPRSQNRKQTTSLTQLFKKLPHKWCSQVQISTNSSRKSIWLLRLAEAWKLKVRRLSGRIQVSRNLWWRVQGSSSTSTPLILAKGLTIIIQVPNTKCQRSCNQFSQEHQQWEIVVKQLLDSPQSMDLTWPRRKSAPSGFRAVHLATVLDQSILVKSKTWSWCQRKTTCSTRLRWQPLSKVVQPRKTSPSRMTSSELITKWLQSEEAMEPWMAIRSSIIGKRWSLLNKLLLSQMRRMRGWNSLMGVKRHLMGDKDLYRTLIIKGKRNGWNQEKLKPVLKTTKIHRKSKLRSQRTYF